MMNNKTDWNDYKFNVLYPQLFEVIDVAFSDMNFTRKAKGWFSPLKLDGSKPKKARHDKTVITNAFLHRALENGQEDATIELTDWTMQRDGSTFFEAIKKLAGIAGVPLPTGDGYNKEAYEKSKQEQTLLELCETYFINQLRHANEAEDVRTYLRNERGYTNELIERLNIGYIPNINTLTDYLKTKGYNDTKQINDLLKLPYGAGTTHTLVIPFKSGGRLKGFKFRTIQKDVQPKYYNTKELDKNGGFYNLQGIKGDKDVIIVEGEFDALHATAKGVNNVVAIAGNNINELQVKDAIKRGAKRFTLILDNEKGKEEENTRHANSAIDVILKETNEVYIATLPLLNGVDKMDVDTFLLSNEANQLVKLVKAAPLYTTYNLNEIGQAYARQQANKPPHEPPTDKEVKDLQRNFITYGATIKSNLDYKEYLNRLTKTLELNNLGSAKEIQTLIDERRRNEAQAARDKAFNKLLNEAKNNEDKTKALETLKDGLNELSIDENADDFEKLLKPTSEEQMFLEVGEESDGVNTGYFLGQSNDGVNELLLPTGAITVISASTGHGKTTFMINLAVNIATNQKNKGKVYLFTLEESANAMRMHALNSYIGKHNLNDVSNDCRKSIKSYFKNKNADMIKRDERENFLKHKDDFFKNLINNGRLNIHHSGMNSTELCDAIRHLHRTTDISAVFIDYIQLLRPPTHKESNSRQREIQFIMLELLGVATDTGISIILGAQFNRDVTNPSQMHAVRMREAGDIEQQANLIIGLWDNEKREALELARTDGGEYGNKEDKELFAKILKNRSGRSELSELFLYNRNTATIANNFYKIDGYTPKKQRDNEYTQPKIKEDVNNKLPFEP